MRFRTAQVRYKTTFRIKAACAASATFSITVTAPVATGIYAFDYGAEVPDTGAANLFVDAASGSDAHTRADVIAGAGTVAWATIGRAMWGHASLASADAAQAAQAGDIVDIAAGTYTDTTNSTGSRLYPLYQPVNSGTTGNYIVFRAVGTVTLQNSTGAQNILGTNNNDYIAFLGDFYVDESNTTSGGSESGVMSIRESSHIYVDGLRCLAQPASGINNHAAIFMQDSTRCTIRNLLADGYNDDGANSAGVETYSVSYSLFEHLETPNCISGIFLKGVSVNLGIQQGNIVRYCDFTGVVNYCVICGGVGADNVGTLGTDYTYIIQNFMKDSGYAAVYFINYDAYTPRMIVVANNVVDNVGDAAFSEGGAWVTHGSVAAYDDIIIQNNIVINSRSSTNVWTYGGAGVPSDMGLTEQYNTYYNSALFAIHDNTLKTLAEWQAYGLETTGLLQTDPLFTGTSDYTLQAGSPSLDSGIDVANIQGGGTSAAIDRGMYITGTEQIGRV